MLSHSRCYRSHTGWRSEIVLYLTPPRDITGPRGGVHICWPSEENLLQPFVAQVSGLHSYDTRTVIICVSIAPQPSDLCPGTWYTTAWYNKRVDSCLLWYNDVKWFIRILKSKILLFKFLSCLLLLPFYIIPREEICFRSHLLSVYRIIIQLLGV